MLTRNIKALFKKKQPIFYSNKAKFHSFYVPESEIIKNKDAVTVYEISDYKKISVRDDPEQVWTDYIVKADYKKKFFQLIPFMIESKFVSKYYVLKMDLYPSSRYLKIYALQMGGIIEKYIPLDYVVPITPYDYAAAQWIFMFKQAPFLDLDMVYANHKTKEMLVFDKGGEWMDEGVEHAELSLDKNYHEGNWYDEFNAVML